MGTRQSRAWQFAVVSAIVDYVAWIGGQSSDAEDRRRIIRARDAAIESHERALLAALPPEW